MNVGPHGPDGSWSFEPLYSAIEPSARDKQTTNYCHFPLWRAPKWHLAPEHGLRTKNKCHSLLYYIQSVALHSVSVTSMISPHKLLQSVFSLASQQPECDMSEKVSGGAELKTDWTKPPIAPNAMGFYSFCPVYEEVIRQPDSARGVPGVFDLRTHDPLWRGDRHWEENQISSHGRSHAGLPIRTSRSDVEGRQHSSVRGCHEVFRTNGGEAVRPICSTVTI